MLALATDHVVNGVFLKNSSILNVLVHGGLSNWDNSVNQIPENAFDKWGGGERSLIGESPVEVDQLHKLAKVKRALFGVLSTSCLVHVGNHDLFVLLLVNQSGEKLIMIENVWILEFSRLKVFVIHHLEYETKDSCEELGGIRIVGSNFGWVNLLVNEMNNVHFKVHQFSVNGVFSWRMEMKLLRIEVSLWNVLVEETDGSSFHVVECLEIVGWFLGILQWEEEGLAALIELVRVLWINGLVVKFEICIFKILLDGHLGLDVDWSTSHT